MIGHQGRWQYRAGDKCEVLQAPLKQSTHSVAPTHTNLQKLKVPFSLDLAKSEPLLIFYLYLILLKASRSGWAHESKRYNKGDRGTCFGYR